MQVNVSKGKQMQANEGVKKCKQTQANEANANICKRMQTDESKSKQL